MGVALLKQFLQSVLAYSGQASIVVIDNASEDSSIVVVEQLFPQIQLIKLDQNYGFCGGYNRGLEQVSAPISILLNSDVEVTPGWLEALLLPFTNNQVAAAQPKILDYNKKSNLSMQARQAVSGPDGIPVLPRRICLPSKKM